MIGVPRLAVLALEHLHAGAVLRAEPKVVGFVVARFVGKAVGVVLVARESRPAAGTHGEEFADQQPAHLAVLLLAQDVLDLAMRLGVVRAVLHEVELV